MKQTNEVVLARRISLILLLFCVFYETEHLPSCVDLKKIAVAVKRCYDVKDLTTPCQLRFVGV